MSEQIKYIIQELNKEPFNKKFNLISFDALRSEQLLQLLNSVFVEVDGKMKMDVKTEDPEKLAIKTLDFLRVMKYKPPIGVDLSTFRQGIISGDKAVIHHILDWMLHRLPELKKRAYLARYLVKVELPPDIEGDADVLDMYDQYEQLIEEFKEVHKQYEALRNSGFSTQEIRKDIGHMEEEREQLAKKTERLKRKVESHPNKDSMLSIARKLREEQDRAEDLTRQKIEQRNSLTHAEQKIQRLGQRLKDIRLSSLGATPEGLLQKLEEEVRVNSYLVKDKLPKEISRSQRYVHDLQKVVTEPAMGQSYLDQLNNKIQAVNAEINQLIEKKMMSNDPIDDKLSLFRQQAAIIARRKLAAAEQLNDVRSELSQLQEDIREKKSQTKDLDGEEVLKGDEFKRYVNKLRGKSTTYKKKRQELAEVKAECGVLTRTVEILQQKEKIILDTLASLEEQKGVGGYHVTQEVLEKVSSTKAELDEQKSYSLTEMSSMVRRLNGKIAEKKARLAPIIKELRPLRQQCQDMTFEYEQKKSSYDSCAAGLDSGLSKLEQEVQKYTEEITTAESKYHYLMCVQEMLQLKEQMVADEIKIYISSDPQEKKKSLREQYNKRIQEQEILSKQLREQQKDARENQEANKKQMKMWSDLQNLLDCKKKCWEKFQAKQQANVPSAVSDRLVL